MTFKSVVQDISVLLLISLVMITLYLSLEEYYNISKSWRYTFGFITGFFYYEVYKKS